MLCKDVRTLPQSYASNPIIVLFLKDIYFYLCVYVCLCIYVCVYGCLQRPERALDGAQIIGSCEPLDMVAEN